MPTYEEISMAIHANTDFKRFINKSLKNNQHVVSPKIGENPVENEEQLNIILDKIIIDGKDSLSKEEIIFLEEYSRSL